VSQQGAEVDSWDLPDAPAMPLQVGEGERRWLPFWALASAAAAAGSAGVEHSLPEGCGGRCLARTAHPLDRAPVSFRAPALPAALL
jgi:hypothetical protein